MARRRLASSPLHQSGPLDSSNAVEYIHFPMPPIPTTDSLPRLIVYHQTHHDRNGRPISALPLIGSGVTHVYIAAIHLNDRPDDLTLNDHASDHERNQHLWKEVKQLQDAGIKVMGMLGGAAKGSYEKLDRDVWPECCANGI